MFEESLLESSNLLRTRNRWSVVAALALQATVATMAVVIPLLHPNVLPLRLPAFAPLPPVPITRTPPPKPVRVEASTASTAPSAPTAPPTQAARLDTQIRNIDPTGFSNEEPAVGTGINMTGSTGNDPLASMVSAAPSSPHVTIAAKPGPVKISDGVTAGILLAPIRPVYPPIAVAARREGVVIIHAIISKTGTIESANVVSGPMMLQGAAIDAIRTAHYRPYLLNGQPTEVDTTFSVVFRLNS